MINRFPDMDTYFTEINHVLLAPRQRIKTILPELTVYMSNMAGVL
jgi:hypothetical protein